MKLWRQLLCRIEGHPVRPGRRLITLIEMRCERCGGHFCLSTNHGDGMLPWDWEFETMFRDQGAQQYS